MRTLFLLCCLHTFILSAQRPVISLEQTEVLYSGIPNYLRIACEGYRSQDLILTITGERNYITHTDGDRYFAFVFDDTNCVISISVRKKQKTILLGSYQYPVLELPKGEALFGELKSGQYSLKLLLEQNQLVHQTESYVSGYTNSTSIESYNLVLMPKNGQMEEMQINGHLISSFVKKKIASLSFGDRLFIHQIQLKFGESYIVLEPISLQITAANYHSFEYIDNPPTRIEGSLYRNGEISPYLYPANKNQEWEQIDSKEKHGIWKTYYYNPEAFEFELHSKDSFYFGKAIYTEYYSNSVLHFRLEFLNDSTEFLSLYNKKGVVIQQGRVLTENDDYSYSNTKFYQDLHLIINRPEMEEHIVEIPSPYFPNGRWLVNDSNGKLKLEVHYGLAKDSLRQGMDKPDPEDPFYKDPTYMLVVPHGECVFYKSDGSILKRVIFENGIELKP